MLALVLAVVVAAPAGARDEREQTDRIAGATRIATAAEIAERTFPDGSAHAVLARAGAFPDALAGSAVAGYLVAPILLTPRDRLADRTAQELAELGVRRVTILGNTSAISQDVERELRDRGYEVVRIGGPTRYETAARIARSVGDGVGTVQGQRTAFVAFGGDFPDALAAGPGAADHVLPVLLTGRDDLHPAAASALDDLGIERVIIPGGTVVVSEEVARDLRDRGIVVDRVAGRDRTETAVLLASYFEAHLGFDHNEVLVSRGDAFPDALAAATHGASLKAPILLTRTPDVVSYDQLQWLVDRAEGVALVRALGGESAITPRALTRLSEVAAPPERTLTYTIGTRGDVSADVSYFAEHVDWTLTDQRGWSLDNDVRWTQVADGSAATIDVYLATPTAVEAAGEGCSSEWSCQPAGTNDVYINEDHWEDSTATFRGERSLDAYRHYVVLHEVGHAPPMDFGHIRCEEYYDDPDGYPAPVMEQQSQPEDVGERCVVNVWPLEGELRMARDRILGSGSSAGASTAATDVTHAP